MGKGRMQLFVHFPIVLGLYTPLHNQRSSLSYFKRYEARTISFQIVFAWAFKIVVDS